MWCSPGLKENLNQDQMSNEPEIRLQLDSMKRLHWENEKNAPSLFELSVIFHLSLSLSPLSIITVWSWCGPTKWERLWAKQKIRPRHNTENNYCSRSCLKVMEPDKGVRSAYIFMVLYVLRSFSAGHSCIPFWQFMFPNGCSLCFFLFSFFTPLFFSAKSQRSYFSHIMVVVSINWSSWQGFIGNQQPKPRLSINGGGCRPCKWHVWWEVFISNPEVKYCWPQVMGWSVSVPHKHWQRSVLTRAHADMQTPTPAGSISHRLW